METNIKTRVRIFFFKTILLAFLISYYTPLLACTSYAVYGNKIYYGMNFDYPNVELKFTISMYSDRKIFQGLFFENGGWSAISGMNNSGIFSSMQMLYPQVTNWPAPKANEITLYDAYISALAQCDSLQQALNFLDLTGTKVIHIPGLSLHDFFADKYGLAYSLEPGADNNLLTKVENNFIVMTNFPNSQFAGIPLNQISGAGADRYINAYQYIQANKDAFSFDNGIETLNRTVQSSGSFPTQVSFVFDPETNEVFVILKRDFTKIWKVSINDGTIETYKGFSRYRKISLDSTGMLASDLQRIASQDNNEIVTDFDGNEYHTIKIGSQEWLAENLRSTHYSDGTDIPGVYNNTNDSLSHIYGRFYTWNAATRNSNSEPVQGICPAGWHIPSNAEWEKLENFLGGSNVAGGKLKEEGSLHWRAPNTGATNESGFTALPGGFFASEGVTFSLGDAANIWTSTQNNSTTAFIRIIGYNSIDIEKYIESKTSAFSVRCIKDTVTTDVESDNMATPESFSLQQNYPNPFNPETNFGFRISNFGLVTLKIYDILGNEVATLVNETKEPGKYTVKFNATSVAGGLPSGIYLYELSAGNFTASKKMILLK